MTRVILGLGSNVGDSVRYLQEAVDHLAGVLHLCSVAPIYETSPMYVEDQPNFLNSALLAQTNLGPLQLLQLVKDCERRVGRQPRQRYGPREIDIDLVAYGSLSYNYVCDGVPHLTVPHPKLAERAFVLAPLVDLVPDLVLPGLGPVVSLLQATQREPSGVLQRSHARLSLPRI